MNKALLAFVLVLFPLSSFAQGDPEPPPADGSSVNITDNVVEGGDSTLTVTDNLNDNVVEGGDSNVSDFLNDNTVEGGDATSTSDQDQFQLQGQIGINEQSQLGINEQGQSADNTGNFSNNTTVVNPGLNVDARIDTRDLKHRAESAPRAVPGSFCSGTGLSGQTGVAGGGLSAQSTVCATLEVAKVAHALGNEQIASEMLRRAAAVQRAKTTWFKRVFDFLNPINLLFG